MKRPSAFLPEAFRGISGPEAGPERERLRGVCAVHGAVQSTINRSTSGASSGRRYLIGGNLVALPYRRYLGGLASPSQGDRGCRCPYKI